MVETTGLTGVLVQPVVPAVRLAGDPPRRVLPPPASCSTRLEKARSRVSRQFGEHLLNPAEVEAVE